MSTMFADTILIVFISVCTALLAEGEWNPADRLLEQGGVLLSAEKIIITIYFHTSPGYIAEKHCHVYTVMFIKCSFWCCRVRAASEIS